VRPFLDGRLIGPLSDAFIAVSTADRDRMISLEGVRPAKIEVIPTAYIPREGADGDDVRGELGLDPATPLIGTVAVLRPQKALQVLLDAFAIVARGRPEPHLVLAGTGVSEDELRAHAAATGVGDRIHFLGLRQDVNAVWRSIDVGAISSDFEGTPIAALEAMFNGTPLVTTSVGGLPDLIDDGVSGLLVPRQDPQALAAGLLRLLDAPHEREAFAKAAALRLDDYRLDRLVGRMEELYERLLARPGRRAARARRDPS
jgi:glycosyltransferase involved in cell wall biosynthesis